MYVPHVSNFSLKELTMYNAECFAWYNIEKKLSLMGYTGIKLPKLDK